KNEQLVNKNIINLHWIHTTNKIEYYFYEKDNLLGIISEYNKIVLPASFSYISDFYRGIAVVKENDKYGYINKDFKIIKKPEYSDAREFFDEISFVKSFLNNKYACIDKNMNLLSDFKYDKVFDFTDELARVVKDNKWGFINKNCKEVIKPKYDYLSNFVNGKAKVIEGSKTYFIDKINLK
ncbi:WG repeat-containing protein, partial [Arcobacter sp. CECT 8985]|uniref:WG repeat-containing protein n=1 Tax=Arcobacter sp. CECT 8985 TaxID=1935424 RepID=UPI0010267D02